MLKSAPFDVRFNSFLEKEKKKKFPVSFSTRLWVLWPENRLRIVFSCIPTRLKISVNFQLVLKLRCKVCIIV